MDVLGENPEDSHHDSRSRKFLRNYKTNNRKPGSYAHEHPTDTGSLRRL